MTLKDRIKQVIPGQVDDRIIEEVVDATKSVRDGATDVGLKGANILDDGLTKLTAAIPGDVDDNLYSKLKNMLRGKNHEVG